MFTVSFKPTDIGAGNQALVLQKISKHFFLHSVLKLDNRREPVPISYYLTSIQMLWHVYIHTFVHPKYLKV